MLNKTIINKYLTSWTVDFPKGRGAEYEWYVKSPSDRTYNFFYKKSEAVDAITNMVRNGHDAKVMLCILGCFTRTITIRAVDEGLIRQVVGFHEVYRPKRDSQRAKVYRWERRNVADLPAAKVELADAEIRDLLDEITVTFNLPPVSFIITKRNGSHYSPSQRKIVLAEGWGRRKKTVLHEMAHHMTPRDIGHGPEFVSAVIRLYTDYLGLDESDLVASLRGVKYDPSKWLTKK